MEDQDDFSYLENFVGKSLLSEIETESTDTDLTTTTPTKTEDENNTTLSDTNSNLSYLKSQDFGDIVGGGIYSAIIKKYYLNDTQYMQNYTEAAPSLMETSGLSNYNLPDISDGYNEKQQLQKCMDDYMHQQEIYRQALQIIACQPTDLLTANIGVSNQSNSNINGNNNNSSKVNHYANKIAESFFSMDLTKSVSQTYGSDVGVDGFESPAETSQFPISRCSSNDENFNGVKEVDDLIAQTSMTPAIPLFNSSVDVVKKATSKQLNTNAPPFVSTLSPYIPNTASSFFQLNDASTNSQSHHPLSDYATQPNNLPKYKNNLKQIHKNYQYRNNNNDTQYYSYGDGNLDYTRIDDNDATWYTQMSDTKLQKNNRGSKGPRPGEFPTFGQNSNAKDGLNFLRRGRGNQNTRFDNDLDFNSQLKISNAFKSDMLNRARSRQLG
eukprot:TRINITY_DN8437_c0_g1_i7.p1 TRINITY_DN8437_c0_g1~~TRINITY_DN8437_c0_g1_i7.p1  ORF type:complete len:439 (-),score=44.82 TRINITY_DN8437_c0_g1_i7:734-2050(-)